MCLSNVCPSTMLNPARPVNYLVIFPSAWVAFGRVQNLRPRQQTETFQPADADRASAYSVSSQKCGPEEDTVAYSSDSAWGDQGPTVTACEDAGHFLDVLVFATTTTPAATLTTTATYDETSLSFSGSLPSGFTGLPSGFPELPSGFPGLGGGFGGFGGPDSAAPSSGQETGQGPAATNTAPNAVQSKGDASELRPFLMGAVAAAFLVVRSLGRSP
ncbi:hypothetical protein B0H16DRAFT_1523224 [Mycena metata]|uniref:Uncharacterized protein n=1 Tax=Mycena metata TaxID=1033252 RepID=A0AAD7JMQ4_9AGAR|nr:hypothetical protein B0H16DRAFT_1523224 [Mycena metata]